MVGKVEIKPEQTLAAQFREKGAVELGGLILVEIGRRECRTALSLSIYRFALETAGEGRRWKNKTMFTKGKKSSLFETKKENRSAESSREGEGRGEWKNGQGLAWWWW